MIRRKLKTVMPRALRRRVLVLFAIVLAQLGAAATGQDYPSKPVIVVLALAAGTGLDTVARTYGDKLAQSLGKPVVFDNKPGASGIVAVNTSKSMPSDGHALLVATSAALALNPTTFKQLTYDPAKDFIPVSLYLKSPFILIVHPSLPVRSVPELVKYVKPRPGQLSFSSSSVGGAPRLTTELFMQIYGLSMINVPYKNSPQSIADVAAGYVQLAFAEAGASQPLIAAKRLRALAVSSLTRFNSLPDVPTLAEATGRPGLEAVSWHAMVTHASTPRPIVNRLHGEMTRILKLPDVRDRIASLDLIPIEPPPVEEAQRYIASETKKWGNLIRSLGLEGSQ